LRTQVLKLAYLLFSISVLVGCVITVEFNLNATWAFTKKYCLILIICFTLITLNTILKVMRTKLLVATYAPTSIKTQFEGMSLGFFFDYLLPLRLGQIIRAYYVSNKDQISFGFVIIAIVIEKCVDIVFMTVTLGLIYISGGIQVGNSSLIFLSLSLIFLIVMGIVVSGALFQNAFFLRSIHNLSLKFNEKLAVQVRHSVWSALFALGRVVRQRDIIVRYFSLAVSSWLCYLVSLYLLFSTLENSTKDVSDFSNALISNGVGLPFAQTFLGTISILPFFDYQGSNEVDPNSLFTMTAWLLIYPAFILLGFFVSMQYFFRKNSEISSPKKYVLDSYDDDNYHDRKVFVQNYFGNKKIYLSIHNELFSDQIQVKRYFNGGSNAITLLLDSDGMFLVRKCVEIDYYTKLKGQFNWLKSQSGEGFVEVLAEGLRDNYYFYDMPYLDDYSGFHRFIHQNTLEDSKKCLKRTFEIMKSSVYDSNSVSEDKSAFLDYLQKNFFERLSEASNSNFQIKLLLEASEVKINGVKYRGLVDLVTEILESPKSLKALSLIQKSSRIHGDLTIDNILIDREKNPILIDPSDDNQFSGPLIDIARIQQSLKYGYEFLVRDDSPVTLDFEDAIPSVHFAQYISVEYKNLNHYLESEIIPDFLTLEEINSLEFHVALLFCRMLPHRIRISPADSVKYLAIGIMVMNEYARGSK
jgi:hypothetical protein